MEEECAEAVEEEAEEAAEEAEADMEEIAKEKTDTAEKDKVATTKVAMEVMMTPDEATTTTIEDHNQATKAVVEAIVLEISHPSL